MDDSLVIESKRRDHIIINTSVIGILTNVALVVFKSVVGLLSHSIAIILDAVNNLSDAAASIITIVGTKLAAKAPDRKHPFGHGRVEYLSALVISGLVMYAGIASLVESVKKIIDPVTPEYTAPTLIIVAVAVVTKIILGRYVKSVGEKVDSDSLANSGADAMLDAVISTATLVAAGVYLIFHISLEAWLGAIISIVIIKSGYDMVSDTISQLLGERAAAQLVLDIKQTVRSYPDVFGAYDLVIHNYGPNNYMASLHIEVPDTLSASVLDETIRDITDEVYKKHHVVLTAVGVYSMNTRDPEAVRVRNQVSAIVLGIEHVMQIHGFYVNFDRKEMRFDAVISFDSPDRMATQQQIFDAVKKEYPDYTVMITPDIDYSEI